MKHFQHIALILTAFLVLEVCQPAQKGLRTGDLLFLGTQGEDPGSMDEAIVAATGNLTHVAIVEVDASGKQWVIDATPQRGVCRYPLDTLIHENPEAVILVKRLRDTSGVSRYVDQACHFLGEPYDLTLLPDNGAHYCSELVFDAYRRQDGSPLFEEKPMNFLATDGTMPPYWEALFEELGMPVPQGTPGTNPQDMSTSPLLETVPLTLNR